MVPWLERHCATHRVKVRCPELLEGLNGSSICCWSKPKSLGARGPGRPPLLPEATQEHMAVLLHNIVKYGKTIQRVDCQGSLRGKPDFRSTWLHGLVSAAGHCTHAFSQGPLQLGRDSRLRLRDNAGPGLAEGILKKPELKIQLISFIASAGECTRDAERCQRGLAHLRVSDEEWATVLEEATSLGGAPVLCRRPTRVFLIFEFLFSLFFLNCFISDFSCCLLVQVFC